MHPSDKNSDAFIDTALELLESHGGEFWMLVKGQSMLPTIREGDRILVQPLQDSPVRGEILAFRRGNSLVAHRLLRQNLDPQGMRTCLTQGDHALSPDPPISIDQVAGRAVLLKRGQEYLRLDTPSWRRVGSAVSLLQLTFPGVGRNTRLRRGIRASLGLGLRLYLAITGQ